jgi:hypothetical protein
VQQICWLCGEPTTHVVFKVSEHGVLEYSVLRLNGLTTDYLSNDTKMLYDLSTLQSCTPKVYKNVEVPKGHVTPTAIYVLD